MLTYMEVHLYYTLPVLAILFFLLRPFHCSQDQLKYVFLSTIAFLTASPWDNYIVYHCAWWYCPTCVTAVVGYVPLEEYMFFIIMSLMTVAFTNLVMRWRLPSAFIKPSTPLLQSICIRLIPIIAFLCIAVKAWDTAVPDTRLFYGSCILWYVCPVMALLWYGAGEYMLRRCQSVLISIVLPTIYLCWVDTVAIGAGTWHISLRTSTGRMVAPNLPLEEFMFFALINTILVFATCAVDRAQAILHIYSPQDVSSFNLIQLTKAFLLPDQALDNQLLNDIDTTWRILRKASFSFYTASAVFSLNIRQDLGILYGFCRATDDLADCEEVPLEKRKEQLVLAREFVKDMFTKTEIDWNRYKGRLPDSCIASFRAFTRLRPVLEIEAVNELLDGYAWDLERRPVTDEKDLVKYSACVASSVGEMCTRLILATSANRNCDPSIKQWTIARARDMGLALQFTNIARDIVTDSQQLGRSYVPRVWLSKQEYDDLVNHSARKLGDERLRELALQLINGAAEIAIRANRGIDRLPSNCQGGVRAACAVYNAIGDAVKEAHGYPDRAHVRGLKRAWIVFKNVYGFSQWKYQPIQMSKERKGKQRAFFVE